MSVHHSPAAVVLLSGGLDSATTAAIAKSRGFALHALTANYGQKHAHELFAAERVARAVGVESHVVLNLDLTAIGGSALTSDLPVPKGRSAAEMSTAIPVTYVPARNTIFLSLALALAEVRGAADIFLGVNAVDYSGYPDCRPEYLAAFERVAQLATKAGVENQLQFKLHAPLAKMSKAEIITLGHALGVDFGLTHSCYDPSPSGQPCRQCDSCLLRQAGFSAAGLIDPLTA